MLVYIICLVLASMAAAESQSSMALPDLDPPYCALRYRRLCQGKGQHIACQFPNPGPGESCVNYTLIKFPRELRHFVTHYINRRRQRLATGSERVRGGAHLPRPEAMMQVEWDRELAMLAQRLADQCSFVHDDCRATVRFPYAGQTVGEVRWRRTSESDSLNVARAVRRVLDAWWGERRRVTARQLTQPFRLTNRGNMWGHFSQLAVWTLRAVGCGAVRHGNKYPKILLVCDFSHTNMLGQRTLVPGPLGPCPIHTARQRSLYPMLCARVRHQETETNLEANHPPTEYEMSYNDAENKNYEEEGKDNFIFEDNTTTHEANEHTSPPRTNKPSTFKRIRVQSTEKSGTSKSLDAESEENDVSFDKVNVRDENLNLNIEEEEPEPKVKENIYSVKKMRNRMKPPKKIKQEGKKIQGSAVTQSSDHEKEQRKTEIYQIKSLHNRGKNREKSYSLKSISPLKHQDTERKVLKNVQDKEDIQNKDKVEDIDTERTVKIKTFEEVTTKIYKIKRIHDKDKGLDRETSQEPKKIQATERRILHHQDSSKRKEIYGRVRPVGVERLTETERIPERELISLKKKIPDRIRNFKTHNLGKEIHAERVRIPEKVFDNREPTEIERQPEIPVEYKGFNRDKPLERILQTTPEEDTSQYFEPDVEIRKPVTKIFKVSKEIASRRRPTTEKQRTRYLLKLSDIAIQQKNFDLKSARKGGLNRQKEFRRPHENQMDKLYFELVNENFKDSIGEPTHKFNQLQPMYAHNKHRMTEISEYESSPRDLFRNLKLISTTAEPRRTQFYEPVELRHRWRPIKDRPERPGARALITNSYVHTSTRPMAAKKNSEPVPSVTMDKDDIEQLFKDTGFNPNWKQYKKILA